MLQAKSGPRVQLALLGPPALLVLPALLVPPAPLVLRAPQVLQRKSVQRPRRDRHPAFAWSARIATRRLAPRNAIQMKLC